MRIRWLGMVIAAASLLQGCASTVAAGNRRAQESLQPLSLFDADSSPRFSLYLSCSSESVSCVTVENAFRDWADARHVAVHFVESNDSAFTQGAPASMQGAWPYRLSVLYRPWMSAGSSNPTLGGYGQSTSPRVGYSAVLYVFDATTGKLLQSVSLRSQESAASDKGPANPYIRDEVHQFVTVIDPAYAKK